MDEDELRILSTLLEETPTEVKVEKSKQPLLNLT